MKRFAHLCAGCFALLASVVTLVVLPPPASAAPSCEKRLLADWLEDGSIDRVYRLQCYEAAIDAMPNDMRDYSDATDAIRRSLAAAVIAPKSPGGGGGAAPSPTAAPEVGASGASAFLPLPLLMLVGVVLASIAAGVVARLLNRASAPGRRGDTR